jgi:hypothetical protein
MQFFSSWPSFKTASVGGAQVKLHSQIDKQFNHLAARRWCRYDIHGGTGHLISGIVSQSCPLVQ